MASAFSKIVNDSIHAWRRRAPMARPPKPEPMIATVGVAVPGSTGGAIGPGRRAARRRQSRGRRRATRATRLTGAAAGRGEEAIDAERTHLDRRVKWDRGGMLVG